VSRILIIEDEPKVASALQEGLEHEHYQAEIAHTGEEGFERAISHKFDVILLDVMLPARNGFEVLRTLRQRDWKCWRKRSGRRLP
jgi:two-component system, OmpR family, copper resistance phosphate regulon response regulator CusR